MLSIETQLILREEHEEILLKKENFKYRIAKCWKPCFIARLIYIYCIHCNNTSTNSTVYASIKFLEAFQKLTMQIKT